MTANRDEFSAAVKRRLAERVGYTCSFPGCGAATIGPSENHPEKVANVGIAAHIVGAGTGSKSPRYDPDLGPEQRKSIENGIWMCSTHGKLIDSDEGRFPVEVLRSWKKLAEAHALRILGRSKADAMQVETTFADLHATVEANEILRAWSPSETEEHFVCSPVCSELTVFEPLRFQIKNWYSDLPIHIRIWTPEDVIYIGTLQKVSTPPSPSVAIPFNNAFSRGNYLVEARLGNNSSVHRVCFKKTVPPPSIKCSPSEAYIGDEVTIKGENFPKSRRFTAFLWMGNSGSSCGELQSDSRGSIEDIITIPDTVNGKIISEETHPIRVQNELFSAEFFIRILGVRNKRTLFLPNSIMSGNHLCSFKVERIGIRERSIITDFEVYNKCSTPIMIQGICASIKDRNATFHVILSGEHFAPVSLEQDKIFQCQNKVLGSIQGNDSAFGSTAKSEALMTLILSASIRGHSLMLETTIEISQSIINYFLGSRDSPDRS